MVGRLTYRMVAFGIACGAVVVLAAGAARADAFYECVGPDGVMSISNTKLAGQKCKVYMDFDATPKKPAGSKCIVQRYRSTLFYKCVKNGVWYVFNKTDEPSEGGAGTTAAGDGSAKKGSTAMARLVSSDELNLGPKPKGAGRVEGLNEIVSAAAAEFGIPEALLLAVIEVESGFNPDVVSPVGAQGLMQLMPVTADYLDLDNPFDPAQNVRAGAKLLRILSDRFEGNVELVMAAYYAGASTVQRAGNTVPSSCEAYVARVMDRYRKHSGQ